MKILFLCGVYADENENEILNNTIGCAEQSANIFQKKLVYGLKKNNYPYQIISAPFIGAYPIRYKKMMFKGFTIPQSEFQYVPFNNIWGIRSLSREMSMKKAIKDYFLYESEEEFLILVYCAHTPFLEAARYAKKLRPKSKICFIVPDLPQYMNLNEGHRRFYNFAKIFDIKKMYKSINCVDSFVLLTESMKEVLNVGNRPYIVVEGIVDNISEKPTIPSYDNDLCRIVYTGKLNIKFGINDLVNAFMKIDNPNYRLILCGDGDAREFVINASAKDKRIEYKGQVSASTAKAYINSADILVNPRQNNEEYTKYSFPSKTIEYLLSGKPVISFFLDGMPEIYKKFLVVLDSFDNFESAIKDSIENENRKKAFFEYAKNNLNSKNIISNIVEMSKGIGTIDDTSNTVSVGFDSVDK